MPKTTQGYSNLWRTLHSVAERRFLNDPAKVSEEIRIPLDKIHKETSPDELKIMILGDLRLAINSFSSEQQSDIPAFHIALLLDQLAIIENDCALNNLLRPDTATLSAVELFNQLKGNNDSIPYIIIKVIVNQLYSLLNDDELTQFFMSVHNPETKALISRAFFQLVLDLIDRAEKVVQHFIIAQEDIDQNDLISSSTNAQQTQEKIDSYHKQAIVLLINEQLIMLGPQCRDILIRAINYDGQKGALFYFLQSLMENTKGEGISTEEKSNNIKLISQLLLLVPELVILEEITRSAHEAQLSHIASASAAPNSSLSKSSTLPRKDVIRLRPDLSSDSEPAWPHDGDETQRSPMTSRSSSSDSDDEIYLHEGTEIFSGDSDSDNEILDSHASHPKTTIHLVLSSARRAYNSDDDSMPSQVSTDDDLASFEAERNMMASASHPSAQIDVTSSDELPSSLLLFLASQVENTQMIMDIVKACETTAAVASTSSTASVQALPANALLALAKTLCQRREATSQVYDHAIELYRMVYQTDPGFIANIPKNTAPPPHLMLVLNRLAAKIRAGSTRRSNTPLPNDAKLLLYLLNDYPRIMMPQTDQDTMASHVNLIDQVLLLITPRSTETREEIQNARIKLLSQCATPTKIQAEIAQAAQLSHEKWREFAEMLLNESQETDAAKSYETLAIGAYQNTCGLATKIRMLFEEDESHDQSLISQCLFRLIHEHDSTEPSKNHLSAIQAICQCYGDLDTHYHAATQLAKQDVAIAIAQHFSKSSPSLAEYARQALMGGGLPGNQPMLELACVLMQKINVETFFSLYQDPLSNNTHRKATNDDYLKKLLEILDIMPTNANQLQDTSINKIAFFLVRNITDIQIISSAAQQELIAQPKNVSKAQKLLVLYGAIFSQKNQSAKKSTYYNAIFKQVIEWAEVDYDTTHNLIYVDFIKRLFEKTIKNNNSAEKVKTHLLHQAVKAISEHSSNALFIQQLLSFTLQTNNSDGAPYPLPDFEDNRLTKAMLIEAAEFACRRELGPAAALLYREAFRKPDAHAASSSHGVSNSEASSAELPEPPVNFLDLLSDLSNHSTQDTETLNHLILHYPEFGCHTSINQVLDDPRNTTLRPRLQSRIHIALSNYPDTRVRVYANLASADEIISSMREGKNREFNFHQCLSVADIVLARKQALPNNSLESIALDRAAIELYQRAASRPDVPTHKPDINALEQLRAKGILEQLIPELSGIPIYLGPYEINIKVIESMATCFSGLDAYYMRAIQRNDEAAAIAIAQYLPNETPEAIEHLLEKARDAFEANAPELASMLMLRAGIIDQLRLAPLGKTATSADYMTALLSIAQWNPTQHSKLTETDIQKLTYRLALHISENDLDSLLQIAKNAIENGQHSFKQAERLLQAVSVRSREVEQNAQLNSILIEIIYWARSHERVDNQHELNHYINFIEHMAEFGLSSRIIKNSLFKEALVSIDRGQHRLAQHLLDLALRTHDVEGRVLPQPQIETRAIDADAYGDMSQRFAAFMLHINDEMETAENRATLIARKSQQILAILKVYPELLDIPLPNGQLALSYVLSLWTIEEKQTTLNTIIDHYPDINTLDNASLCFALADVLCTLSPTDSVTQDKAIDLYHQAFAHSPNEIVLSPTAPPHHFWALLNRLSAHVASHGYERDQHYQPILVKLLNRFPLLAAQAQLTPAQRNTLEIRIDRAVEAGIRSTAAQDDQQRSLIPRARISVVANLRDIAGLQRLVDNGINYLSSDQWRWLAEILLSRSDIEPLSRHSLLLTNIYQYAASASRDDATIQPWPLQAGSPAARLLIDAIAQGSLSLVKSMTCEKIYTGVESIFNVHHQNMLIHAIDSLSRPGAPVSAILAIINYLAGLATNNHPVFSAILLDNAYWTAFRANQFQAAMEMAKHLPNNNPNEIEALLYKAHHILPKIELDWQLIDTLIQRAHCSPYVLVQDDAASVNQTTRYDVTLSERADLTENSANYLQAMWYYYIVENKSEATTARQSVIRSILTHYPQLLNQIYPPHNLLTLAHFIVAAHEGHVEKETIATIIQHIKLVENETHRKHYINTLSGNENVTALSLAIRFNLHDIASALLDIPGIDVEKFHESRKSPLVIACRKAIQSDEIHQEDAFETLHRIIALLPDAPNHAKHRQRIAACKRLFIAYHQLSLDEATKAQRFVLAKAFYALLSKLDVSALFDEILIEKESLARLVHLAQHLEAKGEINASSDLFNQIFAYSKLKTKISDSIKDSVDQRWNVGKLLGRDREVDSLLFRAIQARHEDIALHIVKSVEQEVIAKYATMPQVNCVNTTGIRASHLAASQGFQTLIEKFQQLGQAHFDKQDNDGLTVLDHAILGAADLTDSRDVQKRLSFIQWLSKQNDVPPALNQEHADAAFIQAIQKQYVDLAHYLIDYHPSVNIYGLSVDGLIEGLNYSVQTSLSVNEQAKYKTLAKAGFRALYARLALENAPVISAVQEQRLASRSAHPTEKSLLCEAIINGELDIALTLLYLYPELLDEQSDQAGKTIRELALYHGHAKALSLSQQGLLSAAIFTKTAAVNARPQALQALQGLQATVNNNLARDEIKAIFKRLRPSYPDTTIDKTPVKVSEDTQDTFSCEATYTVKASNDPSMSKKITLIATTDNQNKLNLRVSGRDPHSAEAHSIMATWIHDQQIALLKKNKTTKNGRDIPNTACSSRQIDTLRQHAFIGVCKQLNGVSNDAGLASMVLAFARQGIYVVLSKIECQQIVATWQNDLVKLTELCDIRQKQEDAYLNRSTNKLFPLSALHLISSIKTARADKDINTEENTVDWLRSASTNIPIML